MSEIKPTREETELRDYIIGNLDWLMKCPKAILRTWLDDAIITHTRHKGQTAEQLAAYPFTKPCQCWQQRQGYTGLWHDFGDRWKLLRYYWGACPSCGSQRVTTATKP